MPDPRTLVLLRHGETDWNAQERAQGHADVPLNDVGRTQAQTVAPVLAAFGPARLWSSDLARALQTAVYVASASGLTIEPAARLREYDVGRLRSDARRVRGSLSRGVRRVGRRGPVAASAGGGVDRGGPRAGPARPARLPRGARAR